MLILNLKTYPQVSGNSLMQTLQTIASVVAENPTIHDKLVVAPSMIELGLAVATQPQLNFIAQTAVSKSQGSTTGATPLSLLKEIGINYVLANHSESRLGIEQTVELINTAKSLEMNVVACCENIAEAKQLLAAEPFAILYEPQDLIGSGISVTTRPEAVTEFISLVQGSKSLPGIGAGVSTAEDVKNSIDLGAKIVCLASAFAKAEDKQSFLLELLQPML